MRFRHPDGTIVHLAYCTNVHPAEDLDGVLDQLVRYAEPVRKRLDVARLGLGLWLAHPLSSRLVAEPAALRRLRAELDARGLEVVTLNGFPYRGFHDPVVKHAVYLPDWTDPRRVDHTVDLARILLRLLPEDAVRGSVSTLPLAWREPWGAREREQAGAGIARLGTELAALAAAEGRRVRIGFEPEPGCVVESTSDAVRWLSDLDPEWFGVCLDTCHLATEFEEPRAALDRLAQAGVPVVKTQASAALEAADPTDPRTREALARFVEPRFLHQTRERAADGRIAVDDLDAALTPDGLPGAGPWRVHFHVPLHADPAPPLTSTRPVLRAVLTELFSGPVARTDHIEVETYTWGVLPAGQRPGTDTELADGIAAELDWVRRELLERGLVEVP
ncbi:MAG TPA: metabolite traffic protein EboE [Pseudonocardiaceae bacterium]